jgi:hypothetical protein
LPKYFVSCEIEYVCGNPWSHVFALTTNQIAVSDGLAKTSGDTKSPLIGQGTYTLIPQESALSRNIKEESF